MKKILLCAIFPLVLFLAGTIAVHAAPAEKYEMEFSREIVYAPAIEVDAGSRYIACLYAGSDESFSAPLKENFHSEGYVFTECGQYRVRYIITDAAGDQTGTVTTVLEITDSTSPQITVNGVYAEYYERGESVDILPATVADNYSQNLAASVAVYLGEKDVSGSLQNGKLAITEAGEYKIVYTATDEYGNTGSCQAVFTVAADAAEPASGGGCNASIGTGALLSAVALAAASALLLQRGRAGKGK